MNFSKKKSSLQFKWLGRVVADGGGPLLICNFDSANFWRGNSDDKTPTDFKRASQSLVDELGHPKATALVSIEDKMGLVWSIRGAGFIYVAVHPNRKEALFLKELYRSKEEDEVAMKSTAELGKEETITPVEFEIRENKKVLAFWSPEDCAAVEAQNVDGPVESIGGVQLFLESGRYNSFTGHASGESWKSWWLRLKQADN